MHDAHQPHASLMEHLKGLPDPRINRTKDHELVDLLVIAICTLLCGGESFYDMEDFGKAKRDWFATFLRLPHGIPSHDTFNRLFVRLDPVSFRECFMRWTESLREAIHREVVALDGKALRRARDGDGDIRYIVSAWAESNRLVLGQLKVADKSNEITAVPELLRALELEGCIVTTDAMGCQKKIAREIIEADADYVRALKGNHETVHEEVKAFLDEEAICHSKPAPPRMACDPVPPASFASLETYDKGHGRLETRRYYQSIHLEWFADLKLWEGLRSVGMVESIREIAGKVTMERRYYLSSLPLDIELFARAVRGHWSVENSCHWVLDVVMREDDSRTRRGHAPENLATLRRMAMNLLNRDKTKKRGIKGKQLNASWDNAYLLRLLDF
jgi:predicted transposase YbfD/YdcC